MRENYQFPDRMISVELIIFVSYFVLRAGVYCGEWHCSNDTKCRCHKLNEDIVANCSRKNLTEYPRFDSKVTVIDVSSNNFVFFPQTLPLTLRYLDLSGNKINRFTTSNCCKALETLKLDHNELGNGSVLKTLFNNLTSLQFLSMKGNVDYHLLRNISYMYSEGLFAVLNKLISLHIDGYVSANIGDLFTIDNELNYLDMSGYERTCALHFIKKGMFANFSQIRNLSLSYCAIKGIEKGAFENLQYLQHLDVSNNQELTLDAIPNITYNIHTDIKTLDFANLQCTFGTTTVLKKEHVQYLRNTNLTSLNIAANRIAYAEKEVMGLLPITLKYVNAGDNFLSFGFYVFQLGFLKGLETINVSHQFRSHQTFEDFFSNCNDDYTPSTPSLRAELSRRREHSENENKLSWIFDLKRDFNFTFNLPPNLKVIYIHHSSYTISHKALVFVNNQLTHLFSSNNLFTQILYPLFGLQNMTYLDLSQNLLTNISGIRKNDCVNLKFMNLSFNMLGNSFEDKTNGEIFQNLHSLEVLDLSTNRLTGLAGGVFDFLGNIRHLNISFNKLEKWDVEMSQMKHLVSLDLSHNGISVLSKLTMHALDFSASFNTVSVNLLGNPLMCTCDNMQFLKWLNQPASSGLHFPHKEEYKCVFSNSSSAKIGNISVLIHQMTVECTYYPFITLGCLFFVFLFLWITTWKILHRYRWTLRYWYYVSRSTPKRYKSMENFHYRYDAFISYDEEDSDVALQLIKSLETKKHMHCCIPERDFMPGTNIADNIINAVHVSKKFLCILSGSYVHSYWSMFEFHMGQMDALHSRYREDKNIFIVVLLKDTLQVDCLNPTILNLLQSDSCVTYSDSRDSQYVCVEKLWDLIGCKNQRA